MSLVLCARHSADFAWVFLGCKWEVDSKLISIVNITQIQQSHRCYPAADVIIIIHEHFVERHKRSFITSSCLGLSAGGEPCSVGWAEYKELCSAAPSPPPHTTPLTTPLTLPEHPEPKHTHGWVAEWALDRNNNNIFHILKLCDWLFLKKLAILFTGFLSGPQHRCPDAMFPFISAHLLFSLWVPWLIAHPSFTLNTVKPKILAHYFKARRSVKRDRKRERREWERESER